MIREIIIPKNEEYLLHIPKEYINTRIEILILPFEAETKNKLNEKSDILQRLNQIVQHKSANSIQISQEIILNPYNELSNDIS